MTHAAARAYVPLSPGCTVADRYLVKSVLGQGGMGQVLEVEHLALGRPFALKVLRLEKWSDELVRRFNREARALAKITSPRVAQVTDFGVDPEVGPYYVMEMLEGETLEQRLERDTIVSPRDALAICAELCEALNEVHAAGIVHRDLKPSNVGLPRSGPVGVKLLDFGLAASMDDAFLSKITESHQILGSLPYMSPEQFGTHEPSPAIDIYAVGVVLYESLAGRLPFLAPSTAALIHQILAMPPPPLPSDLSVLGPLEGLLERFLAKEPEKRFSSATAAAHALRDTALALFGAPPRMRSAHPPTRALEDGSLPTIEVSAINSSMAFLPTSAMPEASTGPLLESGTRERNEATSDHSPTIPTDVPTIVASRDTRAPMRMAIAVMIGAVFAVLAGVGTVVLLTVLDDRPAEPAAAPPAVTPTPVGTSPAVAPIPPPVEPPTAVEARPVLAPAEPARAEPPRGIDPPPSVVRPAPEPEVRPLAPTAEPPRPRWRGDTINTWE